MPLGGARPQPLFAVYRTELAFLAAALVADGERRAAELGERAGARVVEPFELLVVDDVAAFDPSGSPRSRASTTPDAYDGALAFPQPLVTVTGGLAGPPELACLDGRQRAAPAARRCRARSAPARRPVDDETPLFAGDVLVPALRTSAAPSCASALS